MMAARQHLKPNGVLAMYNFYWQPWLIDRLANTLQTTFKQNPCVDMNPVGGSWLAVFTISQDPKALQCRTYWNKPVTRAMLPATDNHPFVYLKTNAIPALYQMTLLLIFLLTVVVTLATKGSFTAVKRHADLFFMGMAFLLLETKSIVAFSLLFGNTWVVNALVFSGILVMVYFAIETIARFPRLPYGYLYGLLLAALALEWIIPQSQLLSLPIAARFVVATLLLFSPVYLANLIFASRFQHQGQQSTIAFGVNMIGAMIGGLLEYLALITGYHFLLILIGLFYTLAFLLTKKSVLNTELSVELI